MVIEEVFEFQGLGSVRWAFTRGHVPFNEFMKQLSLEYGTPYPAGDHKPAHSHARCIPLGPDMPGESLIYFHFGPGRGAFPVTYVDFEG